MQRQTFTAALPGGSTASRSSSRDLRYAVVAATTAAARAAQLEASIAEHRRETAAILSGRTGLRSSVKDSNRVAAIRDAETVAMVEDLRAVRAAEEGALVEPFAYGWYEDLAGAERGREIAEKLGYVAAVVEAVAGPGQVEFVNSEKVSYSCPNAADEPGGTATPTKEHKMAKHINTVTVRTAEGDVEVTKTSTHRDYVAATAVEYTDGTQKVLSWHLTDEAARKYSQTKEAGMLASFDQRNRGGLAGHVVILPVRNEVKLSRKEAAEAAELAELEAAVEEAPEAPAAEELVEVPAATETIVAPVDPTETVVLETPAPKKARTRKPAKKVVMAEADVEETVKGGMGEHKVGDVVVSRDGIEWTVAGSAEKGKTVRIVRTLEDGTKKTRLSMHYNITKK
ncbi:hypothetical protein SEA_PRAIRIE_76 [Arthrobacter phage Prairie]|uniref:Uncharacterized protein n=1 Tax=Arthrobacter phage Prairie TaxID=2816463 RepID=A0A8A5LS89_9CAUD|nr:hypothetical protein SEA_PRAIRIE_76 [Arthrobacter phage Prairie]